MHRKKSKNVNSPTESNITETNLNIAKATQPGLVRILPPKHLVKQSFMSTASNLSE